jgi:hypothetical protein
LTWFDQGSNVGFARNLSFLSSKSRGKFVWFIGCGEEVQISQLEALLTVLKGLEPKVTNLVLGASTFNELTQSMESFLEINHGSYEQTKVRCQLPIYSESISQNVWNREIFNSQFAAVSATGDIWPHVELALELANDGYMCSWYLDSHFITIFRESQGWWVAGDSHRILLAYATLLARYPKVRVDYPFVERTFQRLCHRGIATWILMLKSTGQRITPNSPVSIVENASGLSGYTKILILLASSIPGSTVKNLKRSFELLQGLRDRNK